jgi:hypothetical protein
MIPRSYVYCVDDLSPRRLGLLAPPRAKPAVCALAPGVARDIARPAAGRAAAGDADQLSHGRAAAFWLALRVLAQFGRDPAGSTVRRLREAHRAYGRPRHGCGRARRRILPVPRRVHRCAVCALLVGDERPAGAAAGHEVADGVYAACSFSHEARRFDRQRSDQAERAGRDLASSTSASRSAARRILSRPAAPLV